MAAAPTILDTPQLGVSTHLEDVSWLRACELRGRLMIPLAGAGALNPQGNRRPLRAWLNDEIETHLQRLGASPGIATGCDAYALLSDQTYRARLLGYTGLAIAFVSLREFGTDNHLDAADSWALLDFCNAARELHVDVRLASEDRHLLVVPRPVSLEQLAPREFPVLETETPSRVEPAPSAELESAPVPVTPTSTASKPREPASPSSGRSMRAAMQNLLNDELGSLDDVETPISYATERTSGASAPKEAVVDLRSLEASVPTPLKTPPTHAELGKPTEALPTPDQESEKPTEALTPPDQASEKPTETRATEPSPVANDAVAPPVAQTMGTITPTPQPMPAFESASGACVDRLVRELQDTDGTCGWDEIEYRFTHSYLPLQQLLPTIANREPAEKALRNWSSAFADSYRAAFEALKNNRGKRPRMVLDVPTHAFQLSRKLEIEQCKLVLVDAMRADLAPIVMDKLRLQMMHTAECVGDGLLWSALPTTTAAQMELIARGTDSLRHYTGELSEEQLLSRGNDLRRLRPVRVGSHRMYKLDIVQYLTRDTATHDRSKLEQYAAEIATSVGRFLRQQGPNSLVYVFGDHGFGGECEASPENVLVPYLAWRLLG